VELLGIEAPARVLDLCCGPGRHALELCRRGYAVTGVDRTKAYLAEAMQRAEEEKLKVELVEDDMRRFCRTDAFDVVINMYTAFGYFEDESENRQVLGNVYQSLRQGGRLLIETAGKEVLARIFRPRDWHEEEDGTIFLEERKAVRNWSWLEVRWRMYKDGAWRERTIGHRTYSAVELTDLLLECGFTTVECYGDLAGAPYDHQAKRLVAVARK
jgi:SAM-dependent methyltransferase